MMTFAQTWKRHEQTRHHSLLQQLKSEISAHRTKSALPVPQPRPVVATLSTPVSEAPRPKLNKPQAKTRDLVQAVAVH